MYRSADYIVLLIYFTVTKTHKSTNMFLEEEIWKDIEFTDLDVYNGSMGRFFSLTEPPQNAKF